MIRGLIVSLLLLLQYTPAGPVFPTATTGGGPPTANLVAWYKADSLSASPVTTWTDNSTGGHNLTGTASPTWAAGQINGLPAVTLNGTSQFFTMTGQIISNQPLSIYAIFKPASTANSGTLVAAQGGTGELFYGINGPSGTQEADSAQIAVIGNSSTALTVGTWSEVEMTYDGTTLRFFLNGAADGVVASANSFSFNINSIGASSSGSSPIKFANGQLAEILIYTSATHQTAVHAYLLARYGI